MTFEYNFGRKIDIGTVKLKNNPKEIRSAENRRTLPSFFWTQQYKS